MRKIILASVTALCLSSAIWAGLDNNVTAANNQFAFDFYAKHKSAPDNVFFSPYSISSAMVLAYEGARGKTADEIQAVFHFPKNALLRQMFFLKTNHELQQLPIKVANALWLQSGYDFLHSYINLVAKYYSAKITNVDFTEAPEKSRLAINNWVAKRTNGKIQNLLASGMLTRSTRLVITNAIYFKDSWEKPFAQQNTHDQDFNLASGKKITVSMMGKTGKEAKFNYTENTELQALELPYRNPHLSMLVILPRENKLQAVEESLNSAKLTALINSLAIQRINVFLPKFKLTTEYLMAQDLKALGMPLAFSDKANFSGISDREGLAIAQVIHKAFIETSETGTEAAAATAVTMYATASFEDYSKIKVFEANRPFIFLILDKPTGNILFLGRVSNPNNP